MYFTAGMRTAKSQSRYTPSLLELFSHRMLSRPVPSPVTWLIVPIDSRRRPRHSRNVPSEAPPNRDRDDREREKGRIERLIPELVKRLVESGVERLADSPETVRHWANELRLPKELLNAILTHVEDAKSEIFKVVVREVREFLERANLADELSRVLTGVTLEVKTQVRFVPNEAKSGRPQPAAKASVAVTREEPELDSERVNPANIEEAEEKET